MFQLIFNGILKIFCKICQDIKSYTPTSHSPTYNQINTPELISKEVKLPTRPCKVILGRSCHYMVRNAGRIDMKQDANDLETFCRFASMLLQQFSLRKEEQIACNLLSQSTHTGSLSKFSGHLAHLLCYVCRTLQLELHFYNT